MKTKTLDIPFKGLRDYHHGSYLFNSVFQTLMVDYNDLPDEFEITLNRMAHRQVALIWDTNKLPNTAFAKGSFVQSGKNIRFCIHELDEPVIERAPYPEDEIEASMSFDEVCTKVQIAADMRYSVIELWISMIKAMHKRHFTDADGKWVFVRAKVFLYDPNCTPAVLRAELAASLGTKLTRNVVYMDDKKIGEVFFALM